MIRVDSKFIKKKRKEGNRLKIKVYYKNDCL